ncbi:MAG: YfiR family protein [Candidatus Aminicenantes bacterium]|nr:MAG: YfiR family protein [Candidatus Aminicenantes bacterium]
MNVKRSCTLIVLSIMILLSSLSLFSIKDEYYRKAALFRVFSQYIQWPENSGMKDHSKPFVIGVIGKNPFGSILETAYSQEENKIKDKKVEIRYISKMEEIENCHILFISKSVKKELEDILAITRGKPILTIGETEGFAEKGVLFNLYVSRDEIRFEINGAALVESQLIADSQLLSVARIINMPGVKQ